MIKQLEIAKEITSDFTKDWTEKLLEFDLYRIFKLIYTGPESQVDKNKIVVFIIYAYEPNSGWLDLKKDRIVNKTRILQNLEAEVSSDLYKKIIENDHESVNSCIFEFLEELKDWRWKQVFDYLEYASSMSRFASAKTSDEKSWDVTLKEGGKETLTEEVDIAIISRVNKEKGILLDQAYEARIKANNIMHEIKKDFVATDNATQQDFDFEFSDTAKKKNILSWREFIRNSKDNKK